jgi:hypothetical protein
VIISFFEELDLVIGFAGVKELLQTLDYLGLIDEGLFEKCAGHAEGNFEAGILGDKLGKHFGGGEIIFFGDFIKDLPVDLVPEKFVPVGVQPEGLVQLKIKCRYRHLKSFFDN